MNPETHVELIAAIAELRKRYPEWRLGQLLANVAGWTNQELWDIEDEQLLAAALSHLQAISAATPSS